MELIDAQAVRRAVCNVDIPEGVTEGQFAAVLGNVCEALQMLPIIDAVPLDRLCEWLSESSINIPCTSCKNFVNEYCTAIGDKSRPCPGSADDWRRAITEWMEEQDGTDTE